MKTFIVRQRPPLVGEENVHCPFGFFLQQFIVIYIITAIMLMFSYYWFLEDDFLIKCVKLKAYIFSTYYKQFTSAA